LERTLEDHVDWKIEFLSRHLEVTHGWLQEQLSLRSMLVTLWLTILVVILTVLQLFNATNIWKFLKGILGFGTEIN
ncbi:MAG: hypothetical protein NT028_14855, partial [candidate division Zixibacteria bacterium]|nr:hypothetical protein [candidate division Zixibacteria bacterium]